MSMPWRVLLALTAALAPGRAGRAGPVLAYSTYLGGTGVESALQVKVDGTGSAFVSGPTGSLDFPTTTGAYQPAHGGGFTDLFVARIDTVTPGLVYATYLGGSGEDPDYGSNLALDGAGSVYLTGDTTSADFPVLGAFQPSPGGAHDAFVAKLDATGDLVYSTYLGGNNDDAAAGIAVDPAGSAYVTGDTYSDDFPLRGPWQPVLRARDAFVTKLSPAGNALVYSTFLGGSDQDGAISIAVGAGLEAFVTGITVSTDFPTLRPLQRNPGGFEDSFVTAFDPGGSSLLYSTYLGGSGSDRSAAIAAGAGGVAWVAGTTTSADFPRLNPLPGALGGPQDAFLTGIDAAGALIHSTFLGGTDGDAAQGVAAASDGRVLLTGYTASADFPQVAPLQGAFGGGEDAFVAEIDPAVPALVFSTFLGGSGADAGAGVASDTAGSLYVAGGTSSTDFPVVGTPISPPDGAGDAFLARIVACAAPGPIAGTLRAARAGGNLAFTWVDVPGASDYRLRADASAGGTFATVLAGAPGGDPGISIPSPPDPILYFRVSGQNSCGEGPP